MNPATEMRLELEEAAKELLFAYERVREVHRKIIMIEAKLNE